MRRFSLFGILVLTISLSHSIAQAQPKSESATDQKHGTAEKILDIDDAVKASAENDEELDCYRCGFGKSLGGLTEARCKKNHKIWNADRSKIKQTCN